MLSEHDLKDFFDGQDEYVNTVTALKGCGLQTHSSEVFYHFWEHKSKTCAMGGVFFLQTFIFLFISNFQLNKVSVSPVFMKLFFLSTLNEAAFVLSVEAIIVFTFI